MHFTHRMPRFGIGQVLLPLQQQWQRDDVRLLRRRPQPSDNPIPDAGLGPRNGHSTRLDGLRHCGHALSRLPTTKIDPLTDMKFHSSTIQNGLVYY